ncbi:MAG: M20 family metallopeptidase [bacterium]|nr:M20 family metallopeptidase [bacterium]
MKLRMTYNGTDMKWQEALAAWFTQHTEEGVALLRDLVRQDTVNPPGNEYRAAEVVTGYLQRYGIPSTCYEGAPGRTNVLARIGDGAPVVFVPAHTDVVPVGDGWTHDPFDPVVRDGFIYGRGVADDKGPLTSLLMLAAFLKQYEGAFRGTLLAGAVADEECGSTYGLGYLLEQKLVSADYAIVPDTGASIYRVSCGEKGLLHVEVTFTGAQAHGSTPEQGCNAAWAAWEFLAALRAEFGDQIGYCPASAHAWFTPTSINLAQVQGGEVYNIVPGQCRVRLDIRYVPGETQEAWLARLRGYAQQVRDRQQCRGFDVRVAAHMPPYVVEADSPLITAVDKAVRAFTGRRIECVGMSGTTVCKQLIQHGIPAIGWSQDSQHQAHMANERLALSELRTFGVVLGLAFLALGNNLEAIRDGCTSEYSGDSH